MRKTILTIAGALLMGFGATAAKADTLGLDFTNTPFVAGATSQWNFGWEFTVNNTVLLTGLGDFDNGSLSNYAQDQQVGLWDSTGTLLASVFVGTDQGSTQIGFWGFTVVSPIALVAGQTYVVGAQGGAAWAAGSQTAVDSNITYVQDQFATIGNGSNSPLVEPTSTDNAYPYFDAGYLGGNIEYVQGAPEPGTMMLLIPALGLLSLKLRKRRA